MDSGDLYLLPLAVWPTGVLLTTVWVSWLLMGVTRGGFCHLSPHPPLPVPPQPTLRPSPLLSILMAERDGKNTLKFSHQRQRRLAIIKTNRQLSTYFAAQHISTMQGRGLVFVTEYFKWVFLEIPLGVN